jgi:hypothetical protein
MQQAESEWMIAAAKDLKAMRKDRDRLKDIVGQQQFLIKQLNRRLVLMRNVVDDVLAKIMVVSDVR